MSAVTVERMMKPINFEWTKKMFPSVVAAFGEQALLQQVSVFSSQITNLPDSDHETYLIAIRMARAGVPNPHHPILNILSFLQEPFDGNAYAARWSSPLLLLEKRLTQLAGQGIELTEYRNMIRTPHSFDSLIAEVDVPGCLLDRAGKIVPHSPSQKSTPKSYDVHWTYGDFVLRGEVKYFRDWQRKSDGKVLGTLKILLPPELACGIAVKMRRVILTESTLTDVALEVLELYRYASGTLPAPTEITVLDNGNGAALACRQVPFDEWYVREVELMPDEPPETIMVIESAISDGSEDENSVLRNLQSAAAQLPASVTEHELSVIFIGSAIPNSVHDVKAVLFGKPQFDDATSAITQSPGLFSPATQETDLKDIQSAVSFSLVYEEDPEAPSSPKVLRSATAFYRQGALSPRQAAVLQDVVDALSTDTVFNISDNND